MKELLLLVHVVVETLNLQISYVRPRQFFHDSRCLA